jgi:3,4-dihydroxy 2-butanone 4-phosphate synthase/GTP cyclohydrolase II
MKLLQKIAQTELETDFGVFEFVVYLEETTGKEHVALIKPWFTPSSADRSLSPLKGGEAIPLVRVHSECATGDIFSSKFCDCGSQLRKAMKLIQQEGGILIYLRQEGRGLGLGNKIKAYELQRQGADTVEANLKLGRGADERNYDIAAEILLDQGVKKCVLLTNNPGKVKALARHGFEVEQREHRVEVASERGKKYLRTKKEKMGHLL